MRRALLLLTLAALYVACLCQSTPPVETHQSTATKVIKVF